MTERYLGDGLYASFDGYMIKLRAPRADGDHIVFLEPEVWHELVRFHSDCVSGKVKEGKYEDQGNANQGSGPKAG